MIQPVHLPQHLLFTPSLEAYGDDDGVCKGEYGLGSAHAIRARGRMVTALPGIVRILLLGSFAIM